MRDKKVEKKAKEMEETTSAKEVTESTETASSSSYNPCYCFEQAMRALLKCLGLDSTHESSSKQEAKKTIQTSSDDPPPTTEQGMKTMEDEASRSIGINLIRRPSRPPISSGGGGQTN